MAKAKSGRGDGGAKGGDGQPGDYKVGYGRPPKHTQFKPKTSGNVNGRPKNSVGLKDDVAAVSRREIIVSQNGNPTEVRVQRMIVEGVFSRAAKGEPLSVKLALDLMQRFSPDGDMLQASPPLSIEEQAVLQALSKKVLGEDYG